MIAFLPSGRGFAFVADHNRPPYGSSRSRHEENMELLRSLLRVGRTEIMFIGLLAALALLVWWWILMFGSRASLPTRKCPQCGLIVAGPACPYCRHDQHKPPIP